MFCSVCVCVHAFCRGVLRLRMHTCLGAVQEYLRHGREVRRLFGSAASVQVQENKCAQLPAYQVLPTLPDNQRRGTCRQPCQHPSPNQRPARPRLPHPSASVLAQSVGPQQWQ